MKLVNVDKPCNACKQRADVYAIDPCPDGWGDWYCHDHVPTTWWVVDTIQQVSHRGTEGDK